MHVTKLFRPRALSFIAILLLLAPSAFTSARAADSRLDVRLVTDEAEAVLAILAKQRQGAQAAEEDWRRLFESEGYRRLKQREASMKRDFTDEDFRQFVLSEALADRATALEKTLADWRRVDVTKSAQRALAYLPAGARIRAKIYPVIKPRDNSFVFDVRNDPAIFLYLDPQKSEADFDNTLAHELHHIGYGGSCPSPAVSQEIERLPENVRAVLTWTGAFGEGFAMLAAAGGPDIHPHVASKPEDRARWDRDVANFNEDLKKVEKFFLDVLEGRLKGDEISQAGFEFFGTTQGPWYTVGWRMAVLIEQQFRRARLIEVFCDRRGLLAAYNEAAARHNREAKDKLALWPRELIDAMRQPAR